MFNHAFFAAVKLTGYPPVLIAEDIERIIPADTDDEGLAHLKAVATTAKIRTRIKKWFEDAGYIRVPNPWRTTGLWNIEGRAVTVYGRKDLSVHARAQAAQARSRPEPVYERVVLPPLPPEPKRPVNVEVWVLPAHAEAARAYLTKCAETFNTHCPEADMRVM